ncbi:hypothetical protein M8J75_006361 [Diaphorina citri]|nr:hypothetical protein M8J75_006361 [Diaphorina citri]
MTELDATSVLARTLIHHDISYLSEHLTQLVWILGQMSWRDSRFLVKMRKFHSGVRVFHKLLKLRQVHHSPIFVSTLYCLKTLTKSPLLGNILVRDGIAITIETILTNSFIKKILKLGIVSHLLLVFDRWRKFNTSKKYKLCHLILCILQKIVTTSKPSRSLISCDILHRFCLSLPDDPCHYPMITKVFCILNICSGTKTLPVASIASPVTFELPITDTPDFNSDDEDGNDSDEELDEEMDPDDIGDPEDLLLDDEDDSDNEELVDKELMDNQRDRMDKENLRDLVDKDEVGHEITGNIGENDNWSINRRSGNNNVYADHFQEFNALIPNTKENQPDPYTTSKQLDTTWLSIDPDKSERTWLSIDPDNKSERTWLSIDPDNKSDRILRSLDLGNYVSGPDITSSPRLSSPSVGKKSTTNLSMFQDIKSNTRLDKVYHILANRVHSVVPHIKIAYPDLCLIGSVGEGMHATTFVEPLHMENKKNIRNKMLGIIDRMRHPDKMLNNVVYDFDTLYYTTQNTTPVSTLSQQEIGQSLP